LELKDEPLSPVQVKDCHDKKELKAGEIKSQERTGPKRPFIRVVR